MAIQSTFHASTSTVAARRFRLLAVFISQALDTRVGVRAKGCATAAYRTTIARTQRRQVRIVTEGDWEGTVTSLGISRMELADPGALGTAVEDAA